MKTAISVPDEVFESADALAEEMGVSRSELYARAMAEFLAKHRHQEITDRLNAVYGQEGSGVSPRFRTAQAKSVGPEEW